MFLWETNLLLCAWGNTNGGFEKLIAIREDRPSHSQKRKKDAQKKKTTTIIIEPGSGAGLWV